MEAVIVFPHQLFTSHPCFTKERLILLVEEPRFFSAFSFHKKKLIFHRASLKSFEADLKKKGYKTQYVEGDLKTALKKLKISILHIAELDDVYLEKSLNSLAKLLKFRLEIKPSPGFLTDLGDFKSLFKGKKNLRFETFYIHQRRKLALLLNEEGKPLGGKWSLDQENRKKLPRSIHIPKPFKATQGKEVKEAIAYVKQKYAKNPGSAELFNYPTTHSEAKKALQYFLKNRFALFGDYEDAIAQKEPILFHSCLSPLLNVGLLTPDLVIKEAIKYFENHKIPLNSAEGFIRQIIGWREFIRGAYSFIGEKERAANFFKHQRKIPQSFYEATTGILPVDETIKKLQNHAYVHHIERLMILGNFFLLCEIDPNEVYRWFMEFFIDSYDWVMVPNVYGMSQYADGGLMTTKPYFSSSNYLSERREKTQPFRAVMNRA